MFGKSFEVGQNHHHHSPQALQLSSEASAAIPLPLSHLAPLQWKLS